MICLISASFTSWLLFSSVSSAFVLSSRNKSTQAVFLSDFEDLSSDGDDIKEGKDLAKEFYKQIRLREEASPPTKEGNTVRKISKTSSSTLDTIASSKSTKYTGREKGDLDSSGSPSAGLFAGENGIVYASPRRSPSGSSNRISPKDRMMRNEFSLVSIASNEISLLVQMFAVFILLGFTLYIGVSGGITDGSERFGLDTDITSLIINDDSIPSTGMSSSTWL